MLKKLKNMSKNQIAALSIDCVLITVSMVMYFLYTQFDLLGYGIAFLIAGYIQIITRVLLMYLKNFKFNKRLWLGKDFILIVLIAFIASLVILITNSFGLEYNNYIIFNILFIIYISFQICYDLLAGESNG